jgi:hypothetical protein
MCHRLVARGPAGVIARPEAGSNASACRRLRWETVILADSRGAPGEQGLMSAHSRTIG